jgi:hypothetical protein
VEPVLAGCQVVLALQLLAADGAAFRGALGLFGDEQQAVPVDAVALICTHKGGGGPWKFCVIELRCSQCLRISQFDLGAGIEG